MGASRLVRCLAFSQTSGTACSKNECNYSLQQQSVFGPLRPSSWQIWIWLAIDRRFEASQRGTDDDKMLKTPPLQRATETIDTLCGRLQSATLLEDRRGAILGLRSFSKQYPASVASGSLRELIKVLREDGLGQVKSSGGARAREEGGDVDTIRLVLETLLMLFNPDENSPEASEDIVLFMADEFSMVCLSCVDYTVAELS